MGFQRFAKGRAVALLGAAGAFTLALPATFAVANTVTVNPSPSTADGTALIRIESVPFKTIVVEDDSLPADVEVEEQAGLLGSKQIFATRGYAEDSVFILRELVTEKPQDRIIHRGTKLELPKATPAPEPVVEPEPESLVDAEVGQTADRGESQAPTGDIASTSAQYSLSQFLSMGVINWGGYKFTYYSQSVLPGGGLAIPGRHVNAGGYVSDGDGYIVLAGSAPKGTVYPTPFGWPGKIYDRGTVGNHLDVYVR